MIVSILCRDKMFYVINIFGFYYTLTVATYESVTRESLKNKKC